MIDEEVPSADSMIGHNSGSMIEQAVAAQRESLADTLRDGKTFEQRKGDFIRSAAAQIVRDRQSAADAADTVKLAGEVWALIDADRRARSDPYREVHLKLSAIAGDFWAPVVDAMTSLRAQIDKWTDEEDARIARQSREQQDAIASMRANAPPDPPAPHAPRQRGNLDYSSPTIAPAPLSAPAMLPARRARIRGDLGGTIAAKESTSYEIEDFSLLPDHVLKSPTVVEAILTVVRATARHMGVPAGIRAITTTGNRIG